MERTYAEVPLNYEERLKRQSLEGSSGTRTREKVLKIKKKKFMTALKVYTATIAVCTGLVVGGGSHVIHNIQDNLMIGEMVGNFQADCINHETHRTLDNEHYYYDYGDIVRYIEENEEDFDTGVYLFYRNTSEYQTGRLMEYSSYGSMDNYLREHNYSDFNQWRDTTRQKIILMNEVDEREQELQNMASEHQMSETAPEEQLGGAK